MADQTCALSIKLIYQQAHNCKVSDNPHLKKKVSYTYHLVASNMQNYVENLNWLDFKTTPILLAFTDCVRWNIKQHPRTCLEISLTSVEQW